MTSKSRAKINQLLTSWPPGTVAVSSWLQERGVYQQLAEKYVKSGWLDRLGQGAYRRSGDNVNWTGGLYALQQSGVPVHVAAGTALEFMGAGHFLHLGADRRVMLMAPPGVRLPKWFREYDWGVRIVFISSRLFSPDEGLDVTDRSSGGYGSGGYGFGGYGSGYAVKLAGAERAAIEVCARVPQDYSYDDARHLVDGLPALRPRSVQILLARCTSVKAKRLFLHLAERAGHAWMTKLDLAGIDLGSGKRVLVKGGRLDAKYLITVPREGEA